MSLTFVVPGPLDTISGGYAYDRAIIAGLRADGHTVGVATPDRLDDAARLVIDSLALPHFADRAIPADAIGLIHHPTSLETGHDEAERDRLHALETTLFARLSRLVATSEATSDRLVAEFGVPAAKISVVHPGTDDAPRAAGSGGPGCAILSVGTLIPRKGHDLLLHALARLFDLDWHLTIVGSAERDPAHAHTLMAAAETLGIARRVTFAGELGQQALDGLWHRTDLFALATHFEGYGMAVAEALKRGIAPVVTSGGAAAARLTPEAGYPCPVGDVVTLSKTLRRAIFDADVRRDIAEGAYAIGSTLPDWATQARAFAKILMP